MKLLVFTFFLCLIIGFIAAIPQNGNTAVNNNGTKANETTTTTQPVIKYILNI